MSVQPVDSLIRTAPSLYTSQTPDTMGKTDFLTLLTTQIRQQDPLNPQDPSEFTAQLTQYGNLEQLISLNSAMEQLQILQLSSNNTQAAGLIGKTVLYEGASFSVSGAQAAPIRFNLGTASTGVTVTVMDSAKHAVRTLNLPSAAAGINAVEWDGLDNNGIAVPDGTYSFTVAAKDAGGNAITANPLASGHVSGISFEAGIPYLNIGGAKVPLNDIYSVQEASAA